MPLDGHAHLVAQGWSGKGNGLRHGAITKPVTVVQKKTLAGIGKDRDEAFPFWDHVFQAAAVSISVKVHNSDDESDKSDNEGSITPALSLKRTSTGIISNRRPTTGTPALSGTTTPSESQASGSATPGPRLSIMAAAKQQAARRMLYTMFYRGPVLTNEEKSGSEEPASVAGLSPSKSASPPPHTRKTVRSKDNKSMSKKRRAEREDEEEDKQERKRRKREAKEKDGKSLPKSKGKGKEMEMEMVAVVGTQASDERDDGDDEALEDSKASKAARKAEKAERKRRKAEKLARKEERRKRKLEEERRQRKLERKAAKIKGVESKTDADEGDSGSQDTTPIDRSAATGTSSASPRHTKVKKKGKKS